LPNRTAIVIDAHAHCGIIDRGTAQSWKRLPDPSGRHSHPGCRPVFSGPGDLRPLRSRIRRHPGLAAPAPGKQRLPAVPGFAGICRPSILFHLERLRGGPAPTRPLRHQVAPAQRRAAVPLRHPRVPGRPDRDPTPPSAGGVGGGVFPHGTLHPGAGRRDHRHHPPPGNAQRRLVAGRIANEGLWDLEQVWADTALASAGDILAYLRRYGHERLLFGSDFPFGHPAAELAKVQRLGLTPETTAAVLGDNFRRLQAQVIRDGSR